MAKKVQKKTNKKVPAKAPEPRVKDFLDLIAPTAVKFNTDHYVCGGTYRCTLALRSYPASTEELALLRRLGEKSGVTVHIYNRRTSAAEEDKIIHNAENKNKLDRGSTSSMKQAVTAEANLQDVAALIASMRKNSEPLIHCAVFIELSARDPDSLRALRDEVTSELIRSKLGADRLLLRQREGFLSSNPAGRNAFGSQFERVLPAKSVANLYPFNYSGKTDPNGFYIGRDRYGSNIIVDLDRRADDKTTANVLILGNSGQGKSYLLKLLLCNILESGKSAICLDTEHELVDLCSNLGGCFIDLMSGQYRINPLEPKLWDDGSEGDDPDAPAAFRQKTRLSQHILNARLERAADFIVHQGTEATENGSWSISFKELEKQTEITVRRGNGLDGMLLEALTHRREVTSAALTDTGIDTAYHLNFCSRIPGQKPCYFTKLPEEQKTQLFYEAVETLLDFFGDENLYGVLHNGLQMPNEEILARGYLTTEAMLAAGTVMSLPENSGISLRDVLQYELTEDLSLVHAQGGEPVPLEQEEELTRTERKRFSDVLDAHVLESRAGEHGTELVIGGVKPERLERFRSILDAYKPEDQSMETIQ